MKNQTKLIPLFLSLLCCLLFSPMINAQSNAPDSGVDGDHFSLEGALDLFKAADSPEKFEALLNTPNNDVNNLDLNEDGQVDYIRVEDHNDGGVHALVLQVALDDKEVQDVAVIEMEQTGKEEVLLQILGDENLFGEQIIIEPTEEEAQLSPNGKGGPSAAITTTRVIFNVWFWPSVRFMYRPTYRVYASPYRWNRYPVYYKPWRPRTRSVFRAAIVPRPYCRVVTTHRVVKAHRVYAPKRRTSVVVHKRTTTRIAARPKVQPNRTKVSTTKVVAKKNKNSTAIGKQKTTTTRVKTNRGNVKGKKTTTVGAKKGKNGTVVKKKTTTKKVKRRK